MFKKVLSASLVALLIFGCGGGGSGKNPQPPPPATLGSSNFPTAERVVEYLQIHASGGPWTGAGGEYGDRPGLVRFASPPTLHLAEGATGHERAITLYAVALINRALPYDWHLRIGPDVPAGRAHQWQQGLPYIPDSQIFIEWHRQSASGRASPAVGHQHRHAVYDDQQGRWENKQLRASAVEMDSDFFDGRPDYQAVSVMVHELLHGLGFRGHVPCASYSDSNMCDAWFRLDGSLPEIDAASLLALYLRLGEETEPEELSASSLSPVCPPNADCLPSSFGPWSEKTIHLSGELDDVAFGVRHSNGVRMPWTLGNEPSSALEDNNSLSGTVTWNGGLLGFTPGLKVVGGNAELSINLETMDGRADFTELQSWDAGATPGALGTGSKWNTGSLGYTITVGANYLRSTGGDDGTVNGQFYGTDHEGVAGSLERADLTAAFGATRD